MKPQRIKLSFLTTALFSLLLSACVSQPQSEDAEFNHQQAAKARVELALGYLNQHNLAQARLNLDKALSYAPNYYLVHSALGYFYQQAGEVAQAKQAYLTALSLSHQQGDVLNNYGAFLCQQGEFSQAYRTFEQALAAPNYYRQADSYENMALCALAEKNNAVFHSALAQLGKIAPAKAEKLAALWRL